jgi:hypothetical protein
VSSLLSRGSHALSTHKGADQTMHRSPVTRCAHSHYRATAQCMQGDRWRRSHFWAQSNRGDRYSRCRGSSRKSCCTFKWTRRYHPSVTSKSARGMRQVAGSVQLSARATQMGRNAPSKDGADENGTPQRRGLACTGQRLGRWRRGRVIWA